MTALKILLRSAVTADWEAEICRSLLVKKGKKTDQEVSKYSFYDRLEHYMERELIKEENRKLVELAIMVEAGANVHEMGVMTKELRAN